MINLFKEILIYNKNSPFLLSQLPTEIRAKIAVIKRVSPSGTTFQVWNPTTNSFQFPGLECGKIYVVESVDGTSLPYLLAPNGSTDDGLRSANDYDKNICSGPTPTPTNTPTPTPTSTPLPVTLYACNFIDYNLNPRNFEFTYDSDFYWVASNSYLYYDAEYFTGLGTEARWLINFNLTNSYYAYDLFGQWYFLNDGGGIPGSNNGDLSNGKIQANSCDQPTPTPTETGSP